MAALVEEEQGEKGEEGATAPLTALQPLEVQEALFEGLMRQVGQKGPFQQRFNILFNLIFTIFISMPYLNIVMAMGVPDHWCHVPGREQTNFSREQWKQFTIPKDAAEEGGFSKCLMFNGSDLDTERAEAVTVVTQPFNVSGSGDDGAAVVGCQHGWEYDDTWYARTAPSQENWVCDRTIFTSNVFAFNRAGDVIGSFVFGQLGDSIGRRPVFLMTLLLLIVGRGLSVFVAGIYPLFLLTTVMGSIPSSASFQSPFTVGMEVSSDDKRGYIAMLQCLGWTTGICAVPLLAWVFNDWVTMMLITTLPCVPFLLTHKYFLESPRWLASRGETGRCREVLERIARVNGTQLPPETDATLQQLAGQRERVFGVASLFSSRRLAVLTVLLSYSWFINSVTYYTLMLHVSSLSGNPFLNYFWQSLVELPGSIVGQVLCDRYGRRWTQAGCFAVLMVAYMGLVGTVADMELQLMTTLLVVFAKFCVTITFYVIYLQCMEIYPTCVRQTGTALASLVGSGLAIVGPYILYLGEYDVRYPQLMMVFLAATGAVASSFLPETLHQQLPETLADAHSFGQDQPYWQFCYRPKAQTSRYEHAQGDAAEKRPMNNEKNGIA